MLKKKIQTPHHDSSLRILHTTHCLNSCTRRASFFAQRPFLKRCEHNNRTMERKHCLKRHTRQSFSECAAEIRSHQSSKKIKTRASVSNAKVWPGTFDKSKTIESVLAATDSVGSTKEQNAAFIACTRKPAAVSKTCGVKKTNNRSKFNRRWWSSHGVSRLPYPRTSSETWLDCWYRRSQRESKASYPP